MHAWEQIQQVVDYIEEHLAEEFDVEELAKMASLSPFYFQRLFKRLVKKPVAEYIRLRRMGRATEALLQKDKRILDIALELGFSSHEHFTWTFRATFGMSPDEYRHNPRTLNRMTKPELKLHYTLIDEGVPLVTNGVVIEINKRRLEEDICFVGFERKVPIAAADGLGVESGVDPLAALWDKLHEQKATVQEMKKDAEEIGVAYPCSEKGFYHYFVGAKALTPLVLDDFADWRLPRGEYVVCTFEAENFEALVTDALYKANDYVYGVWLPKHNVKTEPFCAERYESHGPETTTMELWMKIKEEL